MASERLQRNTELPRLPSTVALEATTWPPCALAATRGSLVNRKRRVVSRHIRDGSTRMQTHGTRTLPPAGHRSASNSRYPVAQAGNTDAASEKATEEAVTIGANHFGPAV